MRLLLTALVVSAVQAVPADVDQDLRVALYDEVCLKAFPDDAAIDRLMATKQAKPMTPAEVRTTLKDDPGRGWTLIDSGYPIAIFLELPPYHACSVRFTVRGGSVAPPSYGELTDRYVADHPGFAARPPVDADLSEFHLHALIQARRLPDGGSEMLMMIDQQLLDPARRARGETGTDRRFVHQLHGPIDNRGTRQTERSGASGAARS